MGKLGVLALLAVAACALGGCASATRGWSEQITITSTPSGATAEVAGLEAPTTCVTPCVLTVKRSADITVTVSAEGYEPQTIPLTKDVAAGGAAGFAGNILLGGLVGMAVDGASCAACDHKPNPVIATLRALPPPPPPPRTRRGPKPRPRGAPVAGM